MKEDKRPQPHRQTPDASALQREFVLVDKDRDGRVDLQEFKELMNGLDAGMSDYEMQIGFREIDINKDGRIDCEEFIAWWSGD